MGEGEERMGNGSGVERVVAVQIHDRHIPRRVGMHGRRRGDDTLLRRRGDGNGS